MKKYLLLFLAISMLTITSCKDDELSDKEKKEQEEQEAKDKANAENKENKEPVNKSVTGIWDFHSIDRNGVIELFDKKQCEQSYIEFKENNIIKRMFLDENCTGITTRNSMTLEALKAKSIFYEVLGNTLTFTYKYTIEKEEIVLKEIFKLRD